MDASATTRPASEAVEHLLRDALAEGDSALASARPVQRHLLAHPADSLLSDALIAALRGMARDVARQLLEAEACGADEAEVEREDGLAAALLADGIFLGHCQALALEGQAAARLQAQAGIEPVLTPLVQDLTASGERAQAALAMAVIAAQARFFQYHRRMELPLRDLPAEVFHRALLALRAHPGDSAAAAEAAERRLRAGYRESDGRLALLARLVTGLGPQTPRALALDEAGPSIFVSALALASGQERDLAMTGLAAGQWARLALSLRTAALSRAEADAQFALLHPGRELPAGFELLPAENAAALLAAAPGDGVL